MCAAAFVALVLAPTGAGAAEPDDPSDAPLTAAYRFAGMDLHVDAIQTVTIGDNRPVARKAGVDPDLGYILVTLTLQNPSPSANRCLPGLTIGFAFKDRSSMDEGPATASFVVRDLTAPPPDLEPLHAVTLIYVFDRWSGQPITRMFVKKSSGCDGNDEGHSYSRFSIPGSYVTALPPLR